VDFTTHYNRRQTPQSEPIPDRADMVENNAGGFGFAVDDWTRLERFLILGSEGGTYYVGERKLTRDNAAAVERCIAVDGPRVVKMVIEISDAGRAPKNDPALFALALCTAAKDPATKLAAFEALSRVARIGTHLFHFVQYVQAFRGWGRGLRHAVADWYEDMDLDRLIEQAIKYKARDGWSHRDVLRQAHPKTGDAVRNAVFRYMVRGIEEGAHCHERIAAAEGLHLEGVPLEAKIKAIGDYRLPREVIPTDLLNDARIWQALLPSMPTTAMIRNLAKMTSVGLLKQLSEPALAVCERLINKERLRKARVHPIQILSAMKVYAQGHGERGKLTWQPVPQVIDALDTAFYLTMDTIEPTGKRWVLGVDVSASMDWSSLVGVPGLTPRDGAAVMAMATVHAEPACATMAFSHQMIPLALSKGMRLTEVVAQMQSLPFGRTDCALPMLWAMEQGIEADVFAIYTDNETWCGQIHPIQALARYREKTGIPAKLAVIGIASTEFSIADPNDGGMMDFVGLDSATPAVLQQFALGPKS